MGQRLLVPLRLLVEREWFNWQIYRDRRLRAMSNVTGVTESPHDGSDYSC